MKFIIKKNNYGFSIIEVLIGIFIFSLGLVSILMIITSSMNLNEYNKNEIIASNLAREQIELFRNIRDSNYKKVYKYNQINPSTNNYNNIFKTGAYYKIENDFGSLNLFPIKVEEIVDFGEGENNLSSKMNNYKLCLDSKDRYTYDCNDTNKNTYFYRYIFLEDVKYLSGSLETTVENAYKVISKVIWYKRGYHEIELKTIVTDWRRL